MDRWIPNVEADIARINDYEGGCTLVRHMLELGHKKLLYLAGPFVNSSQIDRQSGIVDTLREAGLDPDTNLRVIPWDSIPSDPTPSDMLSLLKPFDYTGILAFNDVLAYHTLNALNTIGMRVPDDISLVGFDHIRWHNTYLPPLSSISAEGQGVAQTAVEMLFSRMKNPQKPFQHCILPVKLHLDGTTRKLGST